MLTFQSRIRLRRSAVNWSNSFMLPKPTLHKHSCVLLLLSFPILLPAQEKTDLQQILDRLERLEQENRNLTSEVHALRAELAASHTAEPPATTHTGDISEAAS